MKNILIQIILFYKKYLSPIKTVKCPYFPSCSQYGLEAVEKYGFFKGSMLAVWRILRCNPFSKGGYDPVPMIMPRKYGIIKRYDNVRFFDICKKDKKI